MELVTIRRIREGRVGQAVLQAIEDVGGISRYVASGATVLIKPNLVGARGWRTGTTTNPAVVEAIAHAAWEAGAGDVVIADGSAVGGDTNQVFVALGYDEAARRCGARLVDLNRDPVDVEWPTGVAVKQIPISRTALQADVLINVPVMKTHSQTIVTLSLKNMKGVLHPRGKRKMHFSGLEQGIVDLNRAIAAHLVVVDGTVGQEGLGPHAGDPVEMDLIIAGANRVAVDSVCCRVMGIDPETVPHIRMATEAGLGPLSPGEIALKGESVDNVRHVFRLPSYDVDPYKGVTLCEGTACSGCTGQIALALKELDESGELGGIVNAVGHVSILYGEDPSLPCASSQGVHIFVGKCSRESGSLGVWVPGCPVVAIILQDTLRHLAGLPIKSAVWSEQVAARSAKLGGSSSGEVA